MAAALLVALVTAAVTPPASAVVPGTNGKIAFTRYSPDETSEVFVANADGSNPVSITSNNNSQDDRDPAWSPDGRKIAFTSKVFGDEGSGFATTAVVVANADGSNPVNITGFDGGEDPTWSPDGSKIAFVSTRAGAEHGGLEVFVANADGSNPVNITNNAAVGHAEDDLNPAWSPDGSTIAFRSNRTGDQEVFVANPDGSNPVNITNSDPPDPNDDGLADDDRPAWSPNSSKIAFESSRSGWTEVWVMNADGSNPLNITSNIDEGNYAPEWSPDGTKIALAGDGIYVVNADGSNPVNITVNSWDRDPAWAVAVAAPVDQTLPQTPAPTPTQQPPAPTGQQAAALKKCKKKQGIKKKKCTKKARLLPV